MIALYKPEMGQLGHIVMTSLQKVLSYVTHMFVLLVCRHTHRFNSFYQQCR